MKVAYFGNDWFLGCIDVFRTHGHDISHIFINEQQPYNQNIRHFAAQKQIPVVCKKPTRNQIQNLIDNDVDLFFSVEYGWKIPLPNSVETASKIMTLNVHPTLLPEGRGPSPIPWILLKYPQCAGITLHQLSEEFDQGDIVYQKALDLDERENFESLQLKLEKEIPSTLHTCLADFGFNYQNAKPQSKGSYWPQIENSHRLVTVEHSINDIVTMSRAFGQIGIVVPVEAKLLVVTDISVSDDDSGKPAGTVIDNTESHYTIATKDGALIINKSKIVTVLNSIN